MYHFRTLEGLNDFLMSFRASQEFMTWKLPKGTASFEDRLDFCIMNDATAFQILLMPGV